MDARANRFEIYTFSGSIQGQGSGAKRRGFARAASHQQVIETMAGWGFAVQAVSGAAELRESIEVMELIAARSDEVPASDFINLLTGREGPYRPDEVFAISGRGVGQSSVLGGYVVAAHEDELVAALLNLGFEVQAHLSLQQAAAVLAEMDGLEPGDEGLVDLEEHASVH
ncbi:hypothetical protein [Pseudoxanthomonas kaohsiungensis]|uniref:Uncharacterized protein n=1 Tax=Pseudoxanthomonas kaohsiungensis TaxID=283923 RepID=A0ABW3LYN7_9GAMM|nr:hypothetical protein [Pseudoxanthomonas kaohsiungensis]KAF1702960.1 hypothetical protein CSC66_09300 [Pseudoxanthomonas kaohsiungensis]